MVHTSGNDDKCISHGVLPIIIWVILIWWISWSPEFHRHNHEPKHWANDHLSEKAHLKQNGGPLVKVPWAIRVIFRVLAVNLVYVQWVLCYKCLEYILIFLDYRCVFVINHALEDLVFCGLLNQRLFLIIYRILGKNLVCSSRGFSDWKQ